MILKVGNRSIPGGDSAAKGEELPGEYQILVDDICGIDIELETTDGLVGFFSLIPPLWLSGNKKTNAELHDMAYLAPPALISLPLRCVSEDGLKFVVHKLEGDDLHLPCRDSYGTEHEH